MSFHVYVLNHYSRLPDAEVALIRAQGVEPTVVTDRTDFCGTRDAQRWKGLYENFRRIMRAGMDQAEDWVIILHDDVSVPDRLFERMAHVLQFAQPRMVSFYNPQNTPYLRANREQRHVLLTYTNYWTQCFCFHRDAIRPIYDWGTRRVNAAAPPAEDGYLERYCSFEQVPVQVVVPSLIQHDGFAESTFNIPAKVGRFERQSGTYNPTFDVWAVDWAAEFANPIWDGKRTLKTTRLLP